MADTTTSTPTVPLWMRITLFVSLALNLLIVGALVGFMIRGPGERGDAANIRDLTAVYTRGLSPEDRRALRRAYGEQVGTLRGGREGILRDLQASLDVVRTEPFDRDAFRQRLNNRSANRAEREAVGRTLLVDLLAQMTPAERAAYATELDRTIQELTRRLSR